jgi:transposase InsO family protein
VYPFIEAEKVGGGNVFRACALLEVSRAAYYAYRTGRPSARQRADAELTAQIQEVHDESTGSYGAPRVHAALRRRGRRHGRKRIARLMRCAGMRGRSPRRWTTTTIPDPAASSRADLIRRDFTADTARINARWCGDITYIRTWEGWLYLATVIDIASRRVVGWATAEHLRTDLVDQALQNAVTHRRPARGVVFHSDSETVEAPSTPAPSTPSAPTVWVSRSRSDAPVNAGTTPSPSHSSPHSNEN